MFKLHITFVTLALVAAVLSSPVPAPSQAEDSKALSLPGLGIVTNLLGLGGKAGHDDDGDDGDDDDDSSSGGLLGLKRQDDGDIISDFFQDFTGLLGSRQDDLTEDDSDNSPDDYDNNENTRREEALGLPLLGGGSGDDGDLLGSTGLGGLGGILSGVLGSVGKGLGSLL